MLKRCLTLLLLCTCILLLNACVTPRDVTKDPLINRPLSDFKHWQLSGKLAVITAQERKSVNLSWQQQDTSFSMVLSGVLGNTIADMDYDGNTASVRFDDQQWYDSSPENLLRRVTGWDIPVALLPLWMTGRAEPDDQATRYENGLVKTLSPNCLGCQQWIINYDKYADFSISEDTQLTLPRLIKLTGNDIKLIIRIDNWQAR